MIANPWHEHADTYAEWIAAREAGGLAHDTVLGALLDVLGDVAGLEVLDAGCGEGYLARVLAARGARITGIDVSERLIAMAGSKGDSVAYRVADLCRSLPELAGRFDAIASYLVLNDVPDIRGFARTMWHLARPGAKAVFAFNNPYSAVVRTQITDYFANGAIGVYRGMSEELGQPVRFYHRTLEEYLEAFLSAGFRLTALRDVMHDHQREWLLPAEVRFPYMMVLSFLKP